MGNLLTRHREQMVLRPTSSHEMVLVLILAVTNLPCPWNGVCGMFPGNMSGTLRCPLGLWALKMVGEEQTPMMHLGCTV